MDSLLLKSKAAQEKINQSYLDPERSVLLPEDFENFTGLEFYPIDSKYIVKAEFVRTPDEKPFLMPTTTERLPEYVKYGEAHFQLEGKNLVLSLFKATDRESNYLFLPFTDLTSGDGSYGGGRYLDFELPVEDVLLIDFNKAYNPYCTYNPRYSCPIPPEENDLLVRIEAGVKDFKIP
jgi:uncharacterized protein (DUF1684 family)